MAEKLWTRDTALFKTLPFLFHEHLPTRMPVSCAAKCICKNGQSMLGQETQLHCTQKRDSRHKWSMKGPTIWPGIIQRVPSRCSFPRVNRKPWEAEDNVARPWSPVVLEGWKKIKNRAFPTTSLQVSNSVGAEPSFYLVQGFMLCLVKKFIHLILQTCSHRD